MNEDTAGDGEWNSGADGTRLQADLDAAAVRSGDRVVFTTDLGKEYEYTVAEVDCTWLTFETGQMVHRDRFDRESFAVVRTPEAHATGTETFEAGNDRGPEEGTDEPVAPATDGGDVRTPNAD